MIQSPSCGAEWICAENFSYVNLRKGDEINIVVSANYPGGSNGNQGYLNIYQIMTVPEPEPPALLWRPLQEPLWLGEMP